MATFERIVDYPVSQDLHDKLTAGAVKKTSGGQVINLSNFNFLKTTAQRGINLSVPFQATAEDGYFQLNKNIFEAAAQNMTLLLNTLPEERVVTGIGSNIKRLMFEPRTEQWEAKLINAIRTAIMSNMPSINIVGILIEEDGNKADPNQRTGDAVKDHTIVVKIKFNFAVAPDLTHNSTVSISV